jgi:hypothetical protein
MRGRLGRGLHTGAASSGGTVAGECVWVLGTRWCVCVCRGLVVMSCLVSSLSPSVGGVNSFRVMGFYAGGVGALLEGVAMSLRPGCAGLLIRACLTQCAFQSGAAN